MSNSKPIKAIPVPPRKISSGEVNTEIESNILDNYENPSYHFRLYMMRPRALKARKIGNNASADRVVIAESGVSPIDIDNVEIHTTGSISKEAGTGLSTRFSFTLREPFGVALIDQIQKASYFLDIENFQKFPIFLELSFVGRRHPDLEVDDSDPNDVPLKNLVWTWPLQLTNMAMNVDTGGSTYAINAVSYAEHAYTNQASDLEKVITIETDTIGDFFTQLQEQLNEREIEKSNIGTSGYLVTDKYFFYIDKEIYNAKIVPDNIEQRQNRAASYKVSNGKMQFSFQPGISIDKIIKNVLSLSSYYQRKTKTTTNPDIAGEKRKGEEAIYQTFWRVIADTEVGSYDTNRNDYQRIYKYLIVPYETTTIKTPSNMLAAMSSQQRFDSHRRKGLIKKLYNYVYTGLNDQVLDFELNFNFNWYVALPIQGGITTNPSRKEPASKLTPDQKLETKSLAETLANNNKFVSNSTGFSPLSGIDDILNSTFNGPLQVAQNAISNTQQTISDAQTTANEEVENTISTVQPGLPQIPSELTGIIQSDQIVYTNSTDNLSNALSNLSRGSRISTSANSNSAATAQNSRRSIDYQLDSFDVVEAGNQKILASITESKSGKESVDGQDFAAGPGQTLLSAMFEQAESPVSADLLNIELNIKGDPYWLEPAPQKRESVATSIFRRLMANSGANPDQTSAVETQDILIDTALEENNTLSANTAQQETLMVFRNFTPQEFDPETGLTPAGKKSTNALNGVYAVRMITHSFSGGEFTQRLEGIRDININLQDVDLFVKLADQPEETTANFFGPRANQLSVGDATGAASVASGIQTTTELVEDISKTLSGGTTQDPNTLSTGE